MKSYFSLVVVAVLAVPAAAQDMPLSQILIDGETWRCEGDACVATGGSNQPAARACRRVAARLGAVSAFTYKGVSLSDQQIAACNA